MNRFHSSNAGQSTFDIVLKILPDDEPEKEEVLFVTLTSVTPSSTQRIKASARQLQITIPENDNPGGTFSFVGSMEEHYTMRASVGFMKFLMDMEWPKAYQSRQRMLRMNQI